MAVRGDAGACVVLLIFAVLIAEAGGLGPPRARARPAFAGCAGDLRRRGDAATLQPVSVCALRRWGAGMVVCAGRGALARAPGRAVRAASPRIRMAVLPVEVSTLHDTRYVRMLSTLLCQSFYGVPEPWDVLNPAKQVQRGLVFQEIVQDLTKRIELYSRAGQSPDRSCGALLAAVDAEGNLAGFVDISLTLYDMEARAFQVASGPGRSVPSGGNFERRCYVSNLAVAPAFRRRGVADQLMVAAHELAAALPHAPSDIWLEVNESNEAAVKLYTKLGYECVYVQDDAKDMVRGPLCYYFESVRRLCLSRPLAVASEGGEASAGDCNELAPDPRAVEEAS